LNLLLEASGLEINREKSQVFYFNISRITKRNILRILGFSEDSLPSKYLGAPLSDMVVKQTLWTELLEKMRRKLMNWTFRTLNFPN
jgi:hypothetical protein